MNLYRIDPDHSTHLVWDFDKDGYPDRDRVAYEHFDRVMVEAHESKWKYGIVGKTKIGENEVSTVFLVVDHSFFGAGSPPLLFETMIFPDADYCERCSTWEEAEVQHQKAIESLRASV